MAQVVVVEVPGHVAVGGTAKPPANSAVLIRVDELQQRQRIATGLGDEPVTNLLVQMAGDGGSEQRLRVVAGEAVEGQLRQAAEEPLVGRLPDREQNPDGLGQQAPADELQDLEDAASSHWASSTSHTTGRRDAASASRPNTASPTRNRSGALPVARPNATRTASCWGSGSVARSPSIGAHSWCSAANGSSSSDSTPAS